MSGFLDRLAGLATGRPVEGAARVALPPRFAPVSSAALPNVELATTDDVSVAPKSPVHVAENAATDAAKVRPLEESREASFQAARVTARIDASPVRLENRPAPAEPPRAVVTPKTGVALPQQPPRARAAQESSASMWGARPSEDPSRIHPPLRASAITARGPEISNRAPLNPDMLATRPQAAHAHNVPTPIHVTIDRIDVRVAAPAKTAPAKTRVRRGPSQSLAEYLGSSQRGGNS
jgi:hypothetical protein